MIVNNSTKCSKTPAGRLNPAQIKKIKGQLKRGDKTQIAREIKKTYGHVQRVFRGDYYSDAVFNKALEIIARRTAADRLKNGTVSQALDALKTLSGLQLQEAS